jgi:hypothetical protein
VFAASDNADLKSLAGAVKKDRLHFGFWDLIGADTDLTALPSLPDENVSDAVDSARGTLPVADSQVPSNVSHPEVGRL